MPYVHDQTPEIVRALVQPDLTYNTQSGSLETQNSCATETSSARFNLCHGELGLRLTLD